ENMIVVAGAGSGKTFVLVERYLALLDAHPDWQLNALVAITFTQKAAQEMRDRVRLHLQRQADGAQANVEDAVAAQWAARLSAMDSARIDTIHGLCASILRANAAEAGVDPGFAVLDEIEARALLDDALDDAFRTLDPGDPVLELFAEYGERAVRAELRHLVAADLGELPADFFTFWLDQWLTDAHSLIARFQQQIFAVERFGAVGSDVLSLGWQVCGDALDWFSSQIEQQPLHIYLDVVAQIADLRLPGAPAKQWGEDGAAAKEAFKFIRNLAKDTLDEIGAPPGAFDQRAAHLLPLWSSLARRVRDFYRAAKDERGALDFDDLESLTCDLLGNEDVRARYLGAEFRHVLVDEFQDTNAAQWSIIGRIADPQQPGCLFVVGDPKQSIYGFRGADVSVFEQVRSLIAARRPPVDLSTSFRTHARLIECFNSLFARLLVRDPHSPVSAYEVEFGGGMLAHRAESPSDLPVLELLLFDSERLKAEQDEDASLREWEAAALARRIRELVDQARPVFDKRTGLVRPLDYGDVALLFQAMTHVTLYEAALKREGIPYLTTAGKGYYDRQEVWDLLNLLRALDNPADELALAAALRSPLFSLSDDALLALRLSIHGERPVSLWDALAQPDHVPADEIAEVVFAHRTLTGLRRRAGRVTIAQLLRQALEQTGYLAVLTGLPDGKRKRGNVEKLLEKAETSGRITLSAFTQYLKDMSENEAREGEAALDSEGAVQLLTVHKSKGLEFPLVVLVDSSYQRSAWSGDLVSGRFDGLSCKVYDPQENKLISTYAHRRAARLAALRETAERRRLLYVAATRAQDYLLVSGQVTCKDDKPISSKGWLAWLLDALDARDLLPETHRLERAWGSVQVNFPPFAQLGYGGERPLVWDDLPAASARPELLETVSRRSDAPARTLAATTLADLGSALYADSAELRALYLERWRRRVFHDAPSRIDPVHLTSAFRLGEIVHRAVRWLLPESDDDLRDLLRRYAWEEGIVDQAENQLAVASAYELLQRVRSSDVFAEIARSSEVYREVPFVYRTEQRTFHGVIDLLLRDQSDQWRLIDYKTGWLGESVTDDDLANHARRYHLQVGIYAAAVRELVGIAPFVYIHYIRYARTVRIDQRDWDAALAELEHMIEEMSAHG
ncbi:MAG: UvrD-helicase domain-containing protein, partial [Chloroflexota bacterium]